MNDTYESVIISESKPYRATNAVQTIPKQTILYKSNTYILHLRYTYLLLMLSND